MAVTETGPATLLVSLGGSDGPPLQASPNLQSSADRSPGWQAAPPASVPEDRDLSALGITPAPLGRSARRWQLRRSGAAVQETMLLWWSRCCARFGPKTPAMLPGSWGRPATACPAARQQRPLLPMPSWPPRRRPQQPHWRQHWTGTARGSAWPSWHASALVLHTSAAALWWTALEESGTAPDAACRACARHALQHCCLLLHSGEDEAAGCCYRMAIWLTKSPSLLPPPAAVVGMMEEGLERANEWQCEWLRWLCLVPLVVVPQRMLLGKLGTV